MDRIPIPGQILNAVEPSAAPVANGRLYSVFDKEGIYAQRVFFAPSDGGPIVEVPIELPNARGVLVADYAAGHVELVAFEGTDLERQVVPGYTPLAPTAAAAAPAPAGPAIDSQARSDLAALRVLVEQVHSGLTSTAAKVAALDARPDMDPPAAGLTRDAAWQLIADRVYNLLMTKDPGIVGALKEALK